MDSIDKGATIRIGFREYYKPRSFEVDFKVPEYSVKIDKKTVLISAGPSAAEYLSVYEQGAKEIAQLLNEQNVDTYVIFNGERVRKTNSKWESCGRIPEDGEKLFRTTLESCLD
jgi:hypothetical protein